MSLVSDQEEEVILRAGWTQWTETMADGRIVKVLFWKDPIGATTSYRNELKQAEYANENRRYTLAQALRITRLREETARYKEELAAEEARRKGLRQRTDGLGLSPAELAAQAAREAAKADDQERLQ